MNSPGRTPFSARSAGQVKATIAIVQSRRLMYPCRYTRTARVPGSKVPGSGFGSGFRVRFGVPGSSVRGSGLLAHVARCTAEPPNPEPNREPGTEPGTPNPEPGTPVSGHLGN